MDQFVCLGDSICRGHGVPAGESWVALLAQKVESAHRNSLCVINAGGNGDTSADGLQRLHEAVEVRHPLWLYVQFGINDCWTGEAYAPLFIQNIRSICRRARACGTAHVFVATNHPVSFEETLPDFCQGDFFSRRVRLYNAALRESFRSAGPALPCPSAPPLSRQGQRIPQAQRSPQPQRNLEAQKIPEAPSGCLSPSKSLSPVASLSPGSPLTFPSASLSPKTSLSPDAPLPYVSLIDVEHAFDALPPAHIKTLLAEDGLHLSRQGNIFYCDLVYKALAPRIWA